MSDTGNNQNIARCVASGAIERGQALKVVGQAAGLLQVSTATAATDKVVGFALESVADAVVMTVCVGGVCKALAGGVIIAGEDEFLTPTAAGALVAYAAGDRAVAYFLGADSSTATAADTDLINVRVLHSPLDTIV